MRLHRLSCVVISVASVVISLAKAGAGGDDPIRFAQNPDDPSKHSSLKDLVAPTKASTFKAPQVSSVDLLATGSQRVFVITGDIPTPLPKEYWLVRLEKNWVLLRDRPLKEPTLTTAASRKIVEIATTDGKFKWKLNSEKRIFEGKVQPSPATEEFQVTSKPATTREVEQFLLLSFRRMMNRAIDGIADAPSPSDVAEVRVLAKRRGEEIARRGLSGDIVELYGALPGVLKIVDAQVAIQDRLITEYNAKIKAQMAERRKIADRHAMASMAGMVKMFAGGMSDRQVVHGGLFGPTYIVDRGPVSPELMASGMRDIASSSQSSASQMEMLNNIKEMTDAKQREAMAASISIQLAAVSGLRAKFEEIAHGEYKIPKIEPIPQDEWAKPRRTKADFQPLVDRLASACDQEKEGLGRVNPFSHLDLIFFQSLVPVPDKRKQANLWQELARQTIQFASEFPSDPILDYDRAELLTTSAELALRGAEVELGSERWVDAYHPRAEFALKILDLALKLVPEDPSGRIREKKAQALLMVGRCEEALKLAREIGEIRKESPRYQFLLARIECASGQIDKGLDDLERAIVTLGFPDIDDARRRGGDFPKGDKRFNELTDIQISIDGKLPQGFNFSGPRIVVTNRSRFPLTDVVIELEFFTIKGRAAFGQPAPTESHGYVTGTARLDPNEPMIITLGKIPSLKTTPDGTIYGRVVLTSRQGKSKIYSSK